MQYRRLGLTNLYVSEIAFGCMSLPENEKDSINLLHEALDKGINFFDTADVYNHGDNEVVLGKALKSGRDKVILATKVGNQYRSDGDGFTWNPSPAHIRHSVDKSLLRLGTDYIDLYQLHGGTIEDPIDDIIETFEGLISQGKIRHFGISSIRPNVIRKYQNIVGLTSVMMQYSLLDRRPEETCFRDLTDHGKSVLVRGALAKGLLAGKQPAPYLTFATNEVYEVQVLLSQYSSKQLSPSDIAIRYVLSATPVVAAAVVGIRTPQQLAAACHASEVSVDGKLLSTLRLLIKPHVYDLHR